jgi:hypothetical protein
MKKIFLALIMCLMLTTSAWGVDLESGVSVLGTSTEVMEDIHATDANGFILLDEASTNENPTMCPDRADQDTGIGDNTADKLTLVAGGVEGLTVSEASRTIESNTTVCADDSGDLQITTTAVHAVTVGDVMQFAAGTGALCTGIAASTNYYVTQVDSTTTVNIALTRGGTNITYTDTGTAFTSYELEIVGSVYGLVRTQDGAVGTPSYSFTNDTNTGAYGATADQYSIAAGGLEGLRVTENAKNTNSVAQTLIPAGTYGDDDGCDGNPCNDYTLGITATLNDSTADGAGTQNYYGLFIDLTTTNEAGWDSTYALRVDNDGSQTFALTILGAGTFASHVYAGNGTGNVYAGFVTVSGAYTLTAQTNNFTSVDTMLELTTGSFTFSGSDYEGIATQIKPTINALDAGDTATILDIAPASTADHAGGTLYGLTFGGITADADAVEVMATFDSAGAWDADIIRSNSQITCSSDACTDVPGDYAVYITTENAGGADVLSIADGIQGQEKFIVLEVDGTDDLEITPSTYASGTKITCQTAGDTALLHYNTAIGWTVVSLFGCTDD